MGLELMDQLMHGPGNFEITRYFVLEKRRKTWKFTLIQLDLAYIKLIRVNLA